MSIPFASYYELGRAAVAFSALEAGGFHPVFANYSHANIAAMHIIAFGGITILLPEREIAPAAEWIDFLKENPLEADDPIPVRKYGKWFSGTIMLMSAGLFLPILLMPPLWFLGVSVLISVIEITKGGHVFWTLTSMFWPVMLLHAKYVAGPKFCKGNQNVD